MGYSDEYHRWLQDPAFDEQTKAELRAIANNDAEIKDRFFKSLAFGTGGLRGVIGAGTNRMNVYTVRKATQGLANYILKQQGDGKSMGVVIAHDSRRMSPEFCREAALTLNGNGIKTWVFDSLRPTPVLSFAVRQLGCIAGIVITASHNPPEYNGYKVYWSDGGQIPYPKDEEIIQEVERVADFSQIRVADYDEAVKAGLFQTVPSSLDDDYVANVKAQSVDPDVTARAGDMKIVYTPLHGAGNVPVRRVLKEVGFTQVQVVPEQELPDANFTTVSYPNPEDPKAFALAIQLAEKIGAELVVGTDPDADRVGAVVKDKTGAYEVLSGNMTGLLLTEYILSHKKANGTLPANAAVISTIVSTDMTKVIAGRYGVDYFEVLTGFKYIGEKIKQFEQTGSNTFVFGFEESYGCLAGTYARDKDAVVATMLISEMAADYKTRGMTLYDGVLELYEKYGCYLESIESVTLKGIEGLGRIREIMSALRANPPVSINGIKVAEARDYASGKGKRLLTGEEYTLTLPESDVLYYVMEDGAWFCIRPSGTEPKIKVYFGVKADTLPNAKEKLQKFTDGVLEATGLSR